MIHGLLLGVPFHASPQVEQPVMPVDEAAIPEKPDPAPTKDQLHVMDQVFAHEHERAQVAGLLGLWSTSMLMVDMLQAHLNRPLEDELEPPPRRNPRLPEEEYA
jgi:hypothetical protein